MKLSCRWQEKIKFTAAVGEHEVPMDGKKPVGGETAPSPKELLLAAICGCTGMDVASLLRKGKQIPASLVIEAEADQTRDAHPHVFSEVRLHYLVTGPVDPSVMEDAVRKSMTLYCGVSAMVAKACPIIYKIEVNGAVIAQGAAAFAS